MAHPPEAEATAETAVEDMAETVEEATVEAAVGVTVDAEADHLTVAEDHPTVAEEHLTAAGEDPLDTAAGDKAEDSAIRASETVSRTSTLANRSWSPLKRIFILSIPM